MVTPGYLRELVEYNYWARDRMLGDVAQLSAESYTRAITSSFGSVRDTVTHMYLAEWAWMARWRGETPTSPANRSRRRSGRWSCTW